MPYRLYYEEAEIEGIMADELRKFGYTHGAVDMDAFLEQHLGVVPAFEPLPPGVQGATEFWPDGTAEVKISATLSERADAERGAEHLLRTTMAHEAAHVLLHRILFLQQSEALFGGQTSRQELCRDVRFTTRYAGEWWEWQANRGMAALVLPKSAVTALLSAIRADANEGTLDTELARVFNVSRQAARYRLQQLKGAPMPGQVAWSL
jgi:hypothetical protein